MSQSMTIWWIDDYLAGRVRVGRRPRLTDAQLLTLAVAEVLLGLRSQARWLRLVPEVLPRAFPVCPAGPATTAPISCRPRSGS